MTSLPSPQFNHSDAATSRLRVARLNQRISPIAIAVLIKCLCLVGLNSRTQAQSNGDYGYGAPTASARPTQSAAFAAAASPRRPIGLALSKDEQLLVVANRRAGSVTLIDTAKNQAIAEFPIGRQLSSLASLPSGDTLLATDKAVMNC